MTPDLSADQPGEIPGNRIRTTGPTILAVCDALLCAWFEIDKVDQPNFFEWHNREHMPERMAVPGVRRARRFTALRREDQFLIMYELASVAVLNSRSYQTLSQKPTPWSLRTRPAFRHEERIVAIPVLATKIGAGGFVLTLNLAADPRLVARVMPDHVQSIARQPGVLAVYLGQYKEQLGTTAPENIEQSSAFILIIEAISREHLVPFMAELRGKDWSDLGVEALKLRVFEMQACVWPLP